MKPRLITLGKFLLLVVILNIVRYLIGGPIEGLTIMEPMHRVMPEFPGCFNNDFTSQDFAISFFYNFMLWLAVTWIFLLAYPSMRGSFVVRSLKVFAVCCLFFISLAAIYMNHYIPEIRPFYMWSMVDAIILFFIVGLANGLIFPWLFKKKSSEKT